MKCGLTKKIVVFENGIGAYFLYHKIKKTNVPIFIVLQQKEDSFVFKFVIAQIKKPTYKD